MDILSTEQFEKLKIRPVNAKNISGSVEYKCKYKITKNAVTDIDGNSYDAISIGDQLWMLSNLRTKHLTDGTELKRFKDSIFGSLPYVEYPNVYESEIKDYGLYYNFYAAATEKLAPEGWRIPTYADWNKLFEYIINDEDCNLTPSDKSIQTAHISKSLCSTNGWNGPSVDKNNTDYVGNDESINNISGFNIFPAGMFNGGGCYDVGIAATMMCLDNRGKARGHYVFMYCYNSVVLHGQHNMRYGCSIRCIKD